MSGTENTSPPITFSPLLAALRVPSLLLPLSSPLVLTTPACHFARIVVTPLGCTGEDARAKQNVFIRKFISVSYHTNLPIKNILFNSTISFSICCTDIHPLIVPSFKTGKIAHEDFH